MAQNKSLRQKKSAASSTGSASAPKKATSGSDAQRVQAERTTSTSGGASAPKKATSRDDAQKLSTKRTASTSGRASAPKKATSRDDAQKLSTKRTASTSGRASVPKKATSRDDAQKLSTKRTASTSGGASAPKKATSGSDAQKIKAKSTTSTSGRASAPKKATSRGDAQRVQAKKTTSTSGGASAPKKATSGSDAQKIKAKSTTSTSGRASVPKKATSRDDAQKLSTKRTASPSGGAPSARRSTSTRLKSSASKASVAKKLVLGRGLKALLSDSEARASSTIDVEETLRSTRGIEELPVETIETNPYQPRSHFNEKALEELKQSISVHGLIQPITVRRLGERRYQLISGERRLQACQRLNMHRIPAFIRTAEVNELLEMALIENIQRESLNAIEIGLSYQRLISECKLRHEELAARVGKDRSTVSNYLRLLKLPPAIQAALRDNQLSMGHARSLISVEDPAAQLLLLGEILNKGSSVREIEARVRRLGAQKSAKPGAAPSRRSSTSSSYRVAEQELSTLLGTKVRFHQQRDETGEIRITFFSKDDLNRIIDEIRS